MAIIGTDDEPQLPRVLHDVRHIVIGLARDLDLVLLENVLREGPAAYCVANRYFVVDPRHPLGGGFDETPAGLGNCCGNSLINRLKHAVTVALSSRR
jgi:hypothetical protein